MELLKKFDERGKEAGVKVDQRIFKRIKSFRCLGNLMDNKAQCSTSIKERTEDYLTEDLRTMRVTG